ncbi:nuclear transport factor 2 family protein [Mycobacterium syngnathidarum]
MGTENDNMDVTRKWIDLMSTDVHRGIDEIYAPEFEVILPGFLRFTDKSEFHTVEGIVLEAAPDRRFEIVHAVARGEIVVVEGLTTYSDQEGNQQESFWCAILTIEDGRITSDHSYIDPATYPGAAAVANAMQAS